MEEVLGRIRVSLSCWHTRKNAPSSPTAYARFCPSCCNHHRLGKCYGFDKSLIIENRVWPCSAHKPSGEGACRSSYLASSSGTALLVKSKLNADNGNTTYA